MNIKVLSEVIQAEQEIMQALEFAREEQDYLHAVRTLKELTTLTGTSESFESDPVRLKRQERIKKLLRGLGRLNRAVRQIGESPVGVVET